MTASSHCKLTIDCLVTSVAVHKNVKIDYFWVENKANFYKIKLHSKQLQEIAILTACGHSAALGLPFREK